MMLEDYLQKRKEGELDELSPWRSDIAKAVVRYNRLDAIDWMIQLDSELARVVCLYAAEYGRINILSKVFCKLNLTMLDQLLNATDLCDFAVFGGRLRIMKWLRKYGAKWDKKTFLIARVERKDEIVQYLRAEGCPEPDEYGF